MANVCFGRPKVLGDDVQRKLRVLGCEFPGSLEGVIRRVVDQQDKFESFEVERIAGFVQLRQKRREKARQLRPFITRRNDYGSCQAGIRRSGK